MYVDSFFFLQNVVDSKHSYADILSSLLFSPSYTPHFSVVCECHNFCGMHDALTHLLTTAGAGGFHKEESYELCKM